MRKYSRYKQVKTPLITFLTALLVSITASADDIDIYNAPADSQTKPNILFVLDYSGSMRNDVNGNTIAADDTTTLSRISILRTAVGTLLEENKDKINVGLGSLYNSRASGARWPISGLEEDGNLYDSSIPVGTTTVKDIILSEVNRRTPYGDTATVNALAEAAAYFRGDPVLHSDVTLLTPLQHEPPVWDFANFYLGGNESAALPTTYTPKDAYEYDSPNSAGHYASCTTYVGGHQGCEGKVTFDCVHVEANVGSVEATVDNPASSWSYPAYDSCKYAHPDNFTTPTYVSPLTQSCQSNIMVLISDGEPTSLGVTTTLGDVLSDAGVASGSTTNCEDLSASIFGEAPGSNRNGNCGPEIAEYLATNDINPSIKGTNINTFTIGFGVEGSGKEYLRLLAKKGRGAFYEASEPAELSAALNEVVNGVVAGTRSFAQPSIDINPATSAHDNRTYLSLFTPSGNSAWTGNLKGYFLDDTGLLDVYGNSATISDNDGLRFAENAHSFWSQDVDGDDVLAGGASESITSLAPAPNNRNLFTFLGGPGANVDYLDSSDSNITDAIGDAQAVAALDWLANAPMGDPLHTKPVSVTYGNGEKVVFIMTNQGLIHAFDASNPTEPSATPDLSGGQELFAFMPKELLSNIPKLYQPNAIDDHVYGLDGTITRWHNDINGDGYVDAPAETIKLIFGMRRGGNSYYSLDVTDPRNPVFDWQVSGDDPDFPDLAQTWSRASLVNVIDGGTEKMMLMFGGGYDAAAVDETLKPTFASGNAIYFVDPMNGNMRRTVTDNKMKYSIPSDLTIIDMDRNGTVDRAYFGDLGGQVWRLDFEDIQGTIAVNKIADLNESNKDHQPIFYPPSVSINRDKGERFLAVSLGSGDRTQPMLYDTKNALYMIKDKDIDVGPPDSASFAVVDAADLYDATNNDIGSDNDTFAESAKSALAAAPGWKVFLSPGEKSLSKVMTYQGNIYATTFNPNPSTTNVAEADPCSVSTVSNNLYMMRLLDAQPAELNSNGATSTIKQGTSEDRKTELKEKFTIPPSPTVAYLPKPQIMVGRESLGEVENKIRTVFWHAR